MTVLMTGEMRGGDDADKEGRDATPDDAHGVTTLRFAEADVDGLCSKVRLRGAQDEEVVEEKDGEDAEDWDDEAHQEHGRDRLAGLLR